MEVRALLDRSFGVVCLRTKDHRVFLFVGVIKAFEIIGENMKTSAK
jgi:hypothetical protein